MSPRDIHLVGSVPMASAEQVFETVASVLGRAVKRLPDGETGERGDWITWLEPAFSAHSAFVRSGRRFRIHATGTERERYTLRPGVDPQDVRFDNLFYADVARESYTVFKRLKDAGRIDGQAKFQVDLAPAHSVLWLFVVDELQRAIDGPYNAALKREIDKIAAAIPHDELAIQFDIASAVFARLQRDEASPYGRDKREMQDTFAAIMLDLGNHVSADVDLMFHLCYGDSGHRHVVEPTDMADMVDFTNRLMAGLARPLQLVHMPVPRDRDDDAYFAPLRRLLLPPETELSLGLIHYTDGIDGARRRLATAKRHAERFSLATECGFGRRDPATIPELLRIHLAAANVD